jgi:hypothetical protein
VLQSARLNWRIIRLLSLRPAVRLLPGATNLTDFWPVSFCASLQAENNLAADSVRSGYPTGPASISPIVDLLSVMTAAGPARSTTGSAVFFLD